MRVATYESTAWLELENGTPSAVLWGEDRWEAIDKPTATRGMLEWCPAFITHPPEVVVAWRFVGRNLRTSEVFTFDFEIAEGGWKLANVWD